MRHFFFYSVALCVFLNARVPRAKVAASTDRREISGRETTTTTTTIVYECGYTRACEFFPLSRTCVGSYGGERWSGCGVIKV